MQEYISFKRYSDGAEETIYIDMKPYYEKIGWKYTEENLVLGKNNIN